MDVHERSTTINKGVWAAALLENQHFQDFVEEINKDIYNSWSCTQGHDTEQRDAIYMTRLGVEMVVNKLGTYIENRKVEEANIQLEQEEEKENGQQ